MQCTARMCCVLMSVFVLDQWRGGGEGTIVWRVRAAHLFRPKGPGPTVFPETTGVAGPFQLWKWKRASHVYKVTIAVELLGNIVWICSFAPMSQYGMGMDPLAR